MSETSLKRTRPTSLTVEQANKAWDILVSHAGASARDRDAFVYYLTGDVRGGHEYRFIGLLGFGGKLHYSPTRGVWVNCYPEDLTDKRREIIDHVNELLGRELRA